MIEWDILRKCFSACYIERHISWFKRRETEREREIKLESEREGMIERQRARVTEGMRQRYKERVLEQRNEHSERKTEREEGGENVKL